MTAKNDAVMRGATVLITGAARGMGELFAKRAALAGAAKIALWDVDLPAAIVVAKELQQRGVEAQAYGVNIGDLDQVREGVLQTESDLGPVDVLINNAGIVRGAPFWEHHQQDDITRTIEVNTLGPMWLTREVLPGMIADRSRPKRILNIASAAATLANPNMSVYASSKWAIFGWGESLRLELERGKHGHIAVTTFCPSYVSTGMFEGARGPLFTPVMHPKVATKAAWEGMLRGTPVVMKPWTVKFGMALRGVLPTRVWDAIAGRLFHVYSSMDKFTGRTGKRRS